MMEVYHYTSTDGLSAIQNSGYIEESKMKTADAILGDGVYLTTLTPEEGRERIAHNNWGSSMGTQMEKDGKVERAIRLWIPQNKLSQAKSDRDILVHKGRIYLENYEYEIERLDQGGDGDSQCIIL